jgi:hypothetical protein
MHILATETTPEIIFEQNSHTLTIRGKAINDKENPIFYNHLESLTSQYVDQNQPKTLNINIELTVIDINAGIYLRDFLKSLKELQFWDEVEIQINWFYNSQEMLEMSKEWSAELAFHTEFIAAENQDLSGDKMRAEMIEKLKELNKRLYNAGYYFRVWAADSQARYVMGSFNPFFNYKNVDVYFEEVLWTNLEENASWSDAWYDDQLFLLTRTEMEAVAYKFNLDIPAGFFGFQWNLANREHRLGVVICKSLTIYWLQ